METLNDLVMKQYLLKRELKDVTEQIKKIQEKDTAQLEMSVSVKPAKKVA